MKIIKKKKAMLLTEETLKMILALIGLVLLIYFLTSLYYSSSSQKKHSEAVAEISRISKVVENANSINEDVSSITPAGWYIFSFVGKEKPNQCSGENCLCICGRTINLFSWQIKKCDKTGACLNIPNLGNFNPIKILPGGRTSINIDKSGGLVKVN